MKPLILVLVAALYASPVHSTAALDFSKLTNIFLSEKQKKKKKAKKKRSRPKPRVTQQPKPKTQEKERKIYGYHVVDEQWMARYRVLEAIWDYEIPEDDFIWQSEGKYYVPPVVYRHYEDMAKTPVPTSLNLVPANPDPEGPL